MNQPKLSVVVAAADSVRGAIRCADALADDLRNGTVEVLIAAGAHLDRPPGRLPQGVRWVAAGPGARAARLRWIGLEQARGPLVVFVEDSCVPRSGWVEGWVRGLREAGNDVATGSVGLAGPFRLRCLALLLFEYGPTLEPLTPPVARLAGNNFGSSRRLALDLGREHGEIHEALWITAARKRGGRVRLVPDARVDYQPEFTLPVALRDRFRCGLEFGHLRARSTPLWQRLMLLPAGPAIWMVQMGKIRASVARRPEHRAAWRIALTHLGLLVAAWSLGEWLGWLTGRFERPLALDMEQGTEEPRQSLARRVRDGAVVHLGQGPPQGRRMKGVLRRQGRDLDSADPERAAP